MCQHRKRAVARRALIRDDQNPLPLPVNGSMPECIAWAGIASDMAEGQCRERVEGVLETEAGLGDCASPYIPSRNQSQALHVCGHNGNGSLTTADRVRLQARMDGLGVS